MTRRLTRAAIAAIEKFLARNNATPGMIEATMKSLAMFAQPRSHDCSDAAQLGAVLYALRFEPPVQTSDADDIDQYKKIRRDTQTAVMKVLGAPGYEPKYSAARMYGTLNAIAAVLAYESNRFGTDSSARRGAKPTSPSRPSPSPSSASQGLNDQDGNDSDAIDPMDVRSEGVLGELLGPAGDGSDDSETGNLGDLS